MDFYKGCPNLNLTVQKQGVRFFPSGLEVKWNDIVRIEEDATIAKALANDLLGLGAPVLRVLGIDLANMFPHIGRITFRGGLNVIFGGYVESEDSSLRDNKGVMYSAPLVTELKPELNSLHDGIVASMDLLRTHELADQFRNVLGKSAFKEKDLFKLDVQALRVLADMVRISAKPTTPRAIPAPPTMEEKKALGLMEEIRKRLAAQFARVDFKDQTLKDFMVPSLMVLTDYRGKDVSWQKKAYEERCAAIQIGRDAQLTREDAIAVLRSSDGDNRPLGDPAWSSERKTIVCSDQPMTLEAFAKSKRLNGIMILDAADIAAYNLYAKREERLIFQSGHPQNGCTYIQHPLCANTYYEVNSFHETMQTRKQIELEKILESIGAYSARVTVHHEHREDVARKEEIHVDASAKHGAVKGAAEFETNCGQESSMSVTQSADRSMKCTPPDHPALPPKSELIFYPFEEEWQIMADSVLRGRRKEMEVNLEYKSEYGCTKEDLTRIGAEVKAVLPSFDMHLKAGYSERLHRLTSTKWHYKAVFENEAGERAGKRGEALFRKRAKRYAQSEGHINAEQRADLEAFAQKYGIDEFRMEELIEEAFE